MRILGIDPGLAATGWGCIEHPHGGPDSCHWGAIRTPSDMALPQRLQSIHEGLVNIITAHQPEAVAIEEIFFSRNVKTAVQVAQARGVVLLATANFDLEVAEYTPNEIKKAVSGRGGAGKQQVQKMVASLLGLQDVPRPDHAADALAAALCHAHTRKTARLYAAAARTQGNPLRGGIGFTKRPEK